MKKIKFAAQTAAVLVALPLWFYAEMNHAVKKDASKNAEIKKEKRYTKNGKDKMSESLIAFPASMYANLITN